MDGRARRTAELTLRDLADFYCRMPINDAALELGFGLTALKRRCRELGIERWPFRQLQSIDAMIAGFEEMAYDETVKETIVKLREQKERLMADPTLRMTDALKKLRQAQFKEKHNLIKISKGDVKRPAGSEQ